MNSITRLTLACVLSLLSTASIAQQKQENWDSHVRPVVGEDSEPYALINQYGWATSKPTFTAVCRKNMADGTGLPADHRELRIICGCIHAKLEQERFAGRHLESEAPAAKALDQCLSSRKSGKMTEAKANEYAR